MSWSTDVDWSNLFIPDMPVLEIFIRGTVIYLALFTLLRLVLKRQTGDMSMGDLLVIVLIADAAQNGMAGDYRSLPDGIMLVATLIFWNFALEWLAFRYEWIERFVHPPALLLIKDGRLLKGNMQKELITLVELMSQLHENGVDNIDKVKAAWLEGDGQMSVITRDRKQNKKTKNRSAL